MLALHFCGLPLYWDLSSVYWDVFFLIYLKSQKAWLNYQTTSTSE
jgi:hypothetical protein